MRGSGLNQSTKCKVLLQGKSDSDEGLDIFYYMDVLQRNLIFASQRLKKILLHLTALTLLLLFSALILKLKLKAQFYNDLGCIAFLGRFF